MEEVDAWMASVPPALVRSPGCSERHLAAWSNYADEKKTGETTRQQNRERDKEKAK